MKRFNCPFYKEVIKTLSITLNLIIFALVLSGCGILPKEEEVHTSSIIACDKVDYDIHEVKKGNLVYKIDGKGNFMSPKYYDCTYDFGGDIIKAIHAKEGDSVKKGDILVELDKGDLEYQLKEQKLRLEAAKISYSSLSKISNSDTEKAKLLITLEKEKLESIENELATKKIRAAMDGTIIFSPNLKPGERIPIGEVLFRIANPKDLQLMFVVKKDEDISTLKENMNVKILYDNKEYKGKLVSPAYDIIKKNKEFSNEGWWIAMDNLPNGAGFGNSVDMTLEVINIKDVISIPKKAIKVKDEKHYVIVLENNVRTKKFVEIGAESDVNIEIKKGLKEGDKVILN